MAGKNDSVKNTSRIVLVLVGIVVLSALAYFAFKYFNEKQENEANIAKIDELDTEIIELEEKILSFERTIEDQNMAMAEKDRQLSEKDQQIADLLDRLEKAKADGKLSDGKFRQLEERVRQLQRYVDQYKEQVAVLTAQNDSLTGEVAGLKEVQKAMTESYQALEEEKVKTQKQLAETVKVASVLKVSNLQFFDITKNRNDRFDDIKRRKLRDIKVCFNVMENLIADPGIRDFYIVIENPDGTVKTNMTDGTSGTFFYEGIEKTYTATASVDYNRMTQQICVPYIPEDENKKYQKGIHYVSIYGEGNLVGQSSFRVD